MDTHRKKKGRKYSFGALKIDMSKSYDRVEWNFLRAVLIVMKFDAKWVHWIMECVTSIRYTLLMNGNLTSTFVPTQGLRQEDPLSPYLFLLCANILSISLIQAESTRRIQGVRVGRRGLYFNHLLFADDSLLFFRNDNHSLRNLQCILDWYSNILEQKINLGKSDLFCSPNMPKETQEALAREIQVNLVQCPSKYLGINFKLRGNRIVDFQFLIDKLNSKLQGWKARLLSQAGKAAHIKSILQSLPLYTFSCFKVLEYVCTKMDSIVRAFWWGHEPGERKLHMLNWDKICHPRRYGGLGFKKFHPMNQAMLSKQYWRIIQHPNSLLARTYKAKYHPTCSIQEHSTKPHHSWYWRNIRNHGSKVLRRHMVRRKWIQHPS